MLELDPVLPLLPDHIQLLAAVCAQYAEVNAKFLAAGDNGIGKTTFLHQLVNSYRQAPEVLFRPAAGADDSSMHQFVNDPESLTMRLGPIRVPEERLNIYLSLQVRGADVGLSCCTSTDGVCWLCCLLLHLVSM